MDSTERLRKILDKETSYKVYAQVPSTRDDSFVTIERTGGTIDAFADSPTFAVQAWARTKADAAGIASTLARVIDDWPLSDPAVADARVDSLYDFADPDSRSQRFQLTVHAVIYNTAQPLADASPPPPSGWDQEWDHL